MKDTREITYQERISDNPARARVVRNIVGTFAKIKDGALTERVGAVTDLTDIEVQGVNWP